MSNLGWYQLITTWAKKVGGPKQLIGLIAGGGTLFGGATVGGGIAIKKKISSELAKKRQEAEAAVLYTVKTGGKSNEGLLFKVGDTFRVLEIAGDAGLIEKIGDENNPYFVSLKFLSTISDYNYS